MGTVHKAYKGNMGGVATPPEPCGGAGNRTTGHDGAVGERRSLVAIPAERSVVIPSGARPGSGV